MGRLDIVPSTSHEDERNTMKIMPLGAGNEVGRSCIVLQFKGKNIMLDCGVHPGYSGHGSLPFFDAINAEEIDVLLITHFHIDHVAALPNFTEKTNFKGRIFMTHPTKAVMQMMLRDFLRVSNITVDDQIYDEKDLENCIGKVEIIDFHQEKLVNGVKITPYNAGHVLGACMYLIEIAGVRVLYTGDYSLESDRHLMGAEIPACTPDVLIIESTYGVQVHQSVTERESRFTGQVEAVVRRGGRCLIPVFALGRTQELLLILDEHWKSRADLYEIPIYFASKLAAKALRIYQTYINMMNERIRRQITISNPFQFEFISNLKSLDDFDDTGPCVVMASPGMLQSGVSRQLFERWCTDKRNACIVAGYVVEGTLAKKILSEPSEITTLDGRTLPMNCSVEYISFSAHADFVGTSAFIGQLRPPNIVLVHGEKNEMNRLRTALEKKYNNSAMYKPNINTPANMTELSFEFKGEKIARAIGALATVVPQNEHTLKGYIVEDGFHTSLMKEEDLDNYTNLVGAEITQKQYIPYVQQPFDVLETLLRNMFGDIGITVKDNPSSQTQSEASQSNSENNSHKNKENNEESALVIYGEVTLKRHTKDYLLMQWKASPIADMVADAIIALAVQAQASPASFSLSNHPFAQCCHSHHVSDSSPSSASSSPCDSGDHLEHQECIETKAEIEMKDENGLHSNSDMTNGKPSKDEMNEIKQKDYDLQSIVKVENDNDMEDDKNDNPLILQPEEEDALQFLLIYRFFKDLTGKATKNNAKMEITVYNAHKTAVYSHRMRRFTSSDLTFQKRANEELQRLQLIFQPV